MNVLSARLSVSKPDGESEREKVENASFFLESTVAGQRLFDLLNQANKNGANRQDLSRAASSEP